MKKLTLMALLLGLFCLTAGAKGKQPIAIEKLPREIQQAVYDQIIDGKAAEEEKKAEEDIATFERLHSSLSGENKERLANSGIEIHTESDMRGVMGLMALMSLMQDKN